uniref:lymphocyte function-associated antigen 3-like isoform X3 n=1 Tax=Doryrhamphus excisus TaxID=161450 RepID=UPI0025AE535A|nr:lymphocyte function-associated antigen 3-like isoform X3 [Doryrhamphus excisus]
MANQNALVCFLCTFGLVLTQAVKYGLRGQEINLVPSIFGQPDVILWKHDGNKVVFFDGMEEFVFRPYENRITLDWASAQLTIKDTTYEDSGEYELEVNVYKQVHRSQYTWELIDNVATPGISCEMSDTKQAMLVCSTESKHPHLLDFRWSSRGKQQTGPNLTITVRNEDDDQVYRCDVSNPLTNETASFTAKDCYLDKRSAAVNVAISVIFVVVIVLLIILACVFHKRLRGSAACMEITKKGVFKTHRSAAEVSGSSQGDETVSFLGGASTLPSNQRLHPLIPSDWIDPSQGGEKKMDSSALNEVNTTPEAEDNAGSQQLISREEEDSPAAERPSDEENDSDAAAAAGLEPVSNMATGGEDRQERITSASEDETRSDHEGDNFGIADEAQSETDTPKKTNTKTNQDWEV